MNYNLLIENLTNPALLFFVLGIIAVYVKSDLEIPANSSKFISLYLNKKVLRIKVQSLDIFQNKIRISAVQLISGLFIKNKLGIIYTPIFS